MNLLIAIIFIFEITLNKSQKFEKIERFQKDWLTYKMENNLVFNKHEEIRRLKIFINNSLIIERINRMNLSYLCKMNSFGHLTSDEFKRSFLPQKIYIKNRKNINGNIRDYHLNVNEIDYRDKGVVSDIKDQGECGSCWAFSTTGYLESQYAILKKVNISLSEQELVDCSFEYNNIGCGGGLITNAFQYISEKGITTNYSYPYIGETQQCQILNKTSMITISGYSNIRSESEIALKNAIIRIGPIAASIDASGDGFRFYSSGVYVSKDCSSEYLDHAILIVGFGKNPIDNYIIKNSWGKSWGDKGYMLMGRNMENMCGISSSASYARIKIL